MKVWTANDICDAIGQMHKPAGYVTANDVWRYMGVDAVLSHPNGTMGRGFTLAGKAGLIRNTGRPVKSDHPKRKHGMIMVWEYV